MLQTPTHCTTLGGEFGFPKFLNRHSAKNMFERKGINIWKINMFVVITNKKDQR